MRKIQIQKKTNLDSTSSPRPSHRDVPPVSNTLVAIRCRSSVVSFFFPQIIIKKQQFGVLTNTGKICFFLNCIIPARRSPLLHLILPPPKFVYAVNKSTSRSLHQGEALRTSVSRCRFLYLSLFLFFFFPHNNNKKKNQTFCIKKRAKGERRGGPCHTNNQL